MLCRTAEDTFKRGLLTLRRSRPGLEALALFEAALAQDMQANPGPGQARYRSYYGLLLALTGTKRREGLGLCRSAAEEEFYNPALWLNLGKAELIFRNRRRAHAAFRRGLRLAPENAELRQHMARMGLRRRPVFPFLTRSNPLNVWAGMMLRRTRETPRAPTVSTAS